MPRPAKTTRPKVYRRKRRYVKRTRKVNRVSIPRLALNLFETKKKETRWGEVNINSLSGWYTNGLSMQVPQDDSYSGMEGHIIRGKGISFKGWFRNNATSTMLVRFGVMCIKQGASGWTNFASGTNVLEGDAGNSNITTADSIARMTQRFNGDQLRCVKQYNIKLGAAGSTDGTDIKQFRIWIPLKGQVFRYDGPSNYPTRNAHSFFALNVLGNNDENIGDVIECSGTSTFYYVDP